LRVFLYNATTLQPVVQKLFQNATWWSTYASWAESPFTMPDKNASWDQEPPDVFIQSELPKVLSDRWPEITVVDSAEDADMVLWLVWDYALCIASGYVPLNWELNKGRLPQSCEAHWKLLEWIQGTPRWRRNNGTDHVFIVDSMYSWESYWEYQRPEDLAKALQERPVYRPKREVVQGITRSGILASMEERRLPNHRGHSTFVPIPYYANASKYFTTAHLSRSHLAGIAASRKLPKDITCESCSFVSGLQTTGSDLREKMFRELEDDCGAGECEVVDFNTALKGGRHNISNFKTMGVDVSKVMQTATFCPIPRGDSGGTKRFFAAILAGCIPLVISDNLALPFLPAVDYSKAMLRISESDFMSRNLSIVAFMRSKTPEQVAAMRANLACIQRAMTYSHGCSPLTKQYGACSEAKAKKPDALDYFVVSLLQLRQPSQRHIINVAEYYSSSTKT